MKCVGWYHCFPFEEVKKGEEIIIWGMGEVGHHYVKQVQMTGYCKIVYAVDKNWKQIKTSLVPVFPTIHVKDTPEIPVIIANGDGNVVAGIREQLKEWNIRKYIWKDHIIGQNMVVDGVPITVVDNEPKDRANQSEIIRKPYLEGEESRLTNRSTPYQLAAHIFKGKKFYDVISFDIFGASVFLPFAEHDTLFYLLESIHGIKGFANLRKKAEVEAWKHAELVSGKNAITIEDIYRYISDETGMDVSKAIKKEEDTLLKYCIPNSYILDAYNLCTGKGRKLVFVSDTYYSKKTIEKILNKCGYSEWDDIFLSCKCGCDKKTGEIYNIVMKKYGKNLNYYHIDDEMQNIKQAQKQNFGVTLYHNVNSLGNPYRSSFNGMSKITGGIYSGLVNIHLHRGNDGEKYSIPYEFGFVYGGIQILGFMQWLCQISNNFSVDKILFLSEAGDIYQQIYSDMEPDIPGEQLLWSDAMGAKLLAKSHGYSALWDYFSVLRNREECVCIKDILERLSLQHIADDFEEYYLYQEDKLDDTVLYKLKSIIKNKWDKILISISKEGELVKQYVQGMIGDAKKIALVDMGMDSNQAMILQYLMKNEWNLDVQSICCIEGGDKDNSVGIDYEKMGKNDSVITYINYPYQRELNICSRRLHSSMNPNLCGMDIRDGKLHMRLYRNISREKAVVDDIQNGIREFVRIWKKNARLGGNVLKISADDAGIPFRTIATFDTYFEKWG